MTFDTNLCFKVLGLFYGDWDGIQIVRNRMSTLLYAYSMFWFIFLYENLVKYLFLIFWPRKTVMVRRFLLILIKNYKKKDNFQFLLMINILRKKEFYLCDFAQMMSDSGSYQWMICIGI